MLTRIVYPILIILFCCLSFANQSLFSQYTQENIPRSISLSEAIKIGTDSSLTAFKAKNLYLAGYWGYKAYKAQKLPQLSLNSILMDYNRALTKRYNSGLDIDEYKEQQNIYSYGNIAVSQNLPFSGGTFYFDTEIGRLENFGMGLPVQYSTVPIRVGFNQNLFGFNKFKWQKKIEPLKYDRAKRDYLLSSEKIANDVVQLYFDLLIARKKIEIASTNMANSDTLYSIGQERLKIASLSQADVLTPKVDLLNARDDYARSKKELQKALYTFGSYLRFSGQIPDLVVPDSIFTLQIDLEQALYLALENSPEILEQQQQILEAQRDVDQTLKDNRFQATFNASLGYNQLSNNFNHAYVEPLDQQRVMLGFSIPLVDWGQNKGKYNLARYNYEVVKTSAEQQSLDFKEKVMMAVTDFNSQQSIVLSAAETRIAADMAYATTKARFLLGKSDVYSLSLSLERKDNAEINYLASLQQYWSYYYIIRQLTLYDFLNNQSLSQSLDATLNLE